VTTELYLLLHRKIQ